MTDDSEVIYLEWGETPFDKLSRDELLRHCQRMYAACSSMVCCLGLARHRDEQSPFWTVGSGGQALAEGEQAMRAVDTGFDKESIYRSFYRYARDLLFQSQGKLRIGFDWHVCTDCPVMLGPPFYDALSYAGKPHQGCTGTFRPITWDDLKPKEIQS